jgi:hypothetical protein
MNTLKFSCPIALLFFVNQSLADSHQRDLFPPFGELWYTCAYAVEYPGVIIEYWAITERFEGTARFLSEQACRYSGGEPFGLEVCDLITCRLYQDWW